MGLGLGGFIDGIALHQILQWHHMLTGEHGGEPMTTLAGLEANTVADGFFHLTTWVLVAVAVRMLHHNWRSGRFVPPWRAQLGLMLTGWGTFNVVEGLIDHHLLGIHHVRDDLGGPVGWDVAFLALGAILIVGGLAMARRANREAAAVARPPSS